LPKPCPNLAQSLFYMYKMYICIPYAHMPTHMPKHMPTHMPKPCPNLAQSLFYL
jgi:hypothetical protein